MALIKDEKKNYATIISDGTIRVLTNAANPEAVKRIYKLSDGTEGEKWELVYDALEGYIKDIAIYDGKWGKTLQLLVDEVTLSMGISTSFAVDIMKKIPNVDLNKKVKLVPYAFQSKGKARKGVTIYQNNLKIKDFFFDAEKKSYLNGYPAFPLDYENFDSDDWKTYFIQVNKFLQNYLINNIMPKFASNKEKNNENYNEEVTPGEIDVEELSFNGTNSSVTVDKTPQIQQETTQEQTTEQQTDNIKKIETMIIELAKSKLGTTTDVDIKRIVMERTGLAWIDSNLPSILQKLENM